MDLLLLALVALTLSGQGASSAAAPASAVLGASGVAQSDALEREARQIEGMLIAPCCWTQPVSQHQSQASDEVKKEIRVLLAAGMSREKVLDAFAAQYGARILAEPPAVGAGRFLYVGLSIAFVLSAAALVVVVRRASARPAASQAAPVAPRFPKAAGAEDAAYASRLDEELRNMD